MLANIGAKLIVLLYYWLSSLQTSQLKSYWLQVKQQAVFIKCHRVQWQISPGSDLLDDVQHVA